MEHDEQRSLPKRPAESSTPIQPKKSEQNNELYMWKRLPSDNKFPLPSLPTKDIQLLVKPLGKSLHESFPNQDFDLSERAVSPTLAYSSLNDPHLRNYFRSPSSHRHLVRRGLVTPEGRVKTKLEDYNQYRTYLHHLWSLQASQLIRHQEVEEKKRLQTLFEAVESEDPLCKMIVDGKDRLQVNEVMEELSDILPQGRLPIVAEPVANPLLQSLIEWDKYQDKLLNDYKDRYPAIREWLSDQTKNYKNFMENKINARLNKDEKLRARWEKLRENSRSHFNRANRLQEVEQENRKRRAENRQKAHRKMWAKQKHLTSAINNTYFNVQDVTVSENPLLPRFSEIKPIQISSERRWKDSVKQIESFDESGFLSKTLDEELSEVERSKLGSEETMSNYAEASLSSWSTSFIEMKPEEFEKVDGIVQSKAIYDIAENVIDKLKRKLQRVGNYIELQKMVHLSNEGTRSKSALSTRKISDSSTRLNFATDALEETSNKKTKSVKSKKKISSNDVKLLKSTNMDAQKRIADELKHGVTNVIRSTLNLKKKNQKKSRMTIEKSFDQTDRNVQSETDVHNLSEKCKHNRLKSHTVPKTIDEDHLKSDINKSLKKDTVEIQLYQQPLVVSSEEAQFKPTLNEDSLHNVNFEQQLHVETPEKVLLDEQSSMESVTKARLGRQTFVETTKIVRSESQSAVGSSNEVEFGQKYHEDSINKYKFEKEMRELVETAKEIKVTKTISESDNKKQLQYPSSEGSTEDIIPQSYGDGPKVREFENTSHKGSAKKQLNEKRTQEVYLEQHTAVKAFQNFPLEKNLPIDNSKKVKFQKQPNSSIKHIQLDEQTFIETDKNSLFKKASVIVRDDVKNYYLKEDIKELVETATEVKQTKELVKNSKDLQLEQQSLVKHDTHMYSDSHRESKFAKQLHKSYRHSAREIQFVEYPSFICMKHIEYTEQPNTNNVKGFKIKNDMHVDSAKEVQIESQMSKYQTKENQFEKPAITGDKDIHVEEGAKETLFYPQRLVISVNEVSLKQDTLVDSPKNILFEQPLRKIDTSVRFEGLPLSEDADEVLLQKPLVKKAKDIYCQKLLHVGDASEFQLEQLSPVDCSEEGRFEQDSLVKSNKDFKRIQNSLENNDEEIRFVENSLVESAKLNHQQLEGIKQAQNENEVYCSWQNIQLKGLKHSLIPTKIDKKEQYSLVESTEEVKFQNNSEKKNIIKGTKPSLTFEENDSKTVKELLVVKSTGKIILENDVDDSSQKCLTNEAKPCVTLENTEETSKTTKNEKQSLLENTEEIQYKNDAYDSGPKCEHEGTKIRLLWEKDDYDCTKITDKQEILNYNSKNIPKRYSFLDADDLTVARKYMYEIPDCVEERKTPQNKEILRKDLDRPIIETEEIHSPDVTKTIQMERVDESPLKPKANYKKLEKSIYKITVDQIDTFMISNKDYNKNLSQGNSGYKSLIKISERENFAKKLDTSPKRNILAERNDLKWPLKRPTRLRPDMKHSMSKTDPNHWSWFKPKPASHIDLTQEEHYIDLHNESMAYIVNYQADRKLREKLSMPFYKNIFEQQKKKLDDDFNQYIESRRTSSVDSSVGRVVDCTWSRITPYTCESQSFTNLHKSQDKDISRNIFKENKKKLDEDFTKYISNRKDGICASTILPKIQAHFVDETKMECPVERVKESAFESQDELEKVIKADINKIKEELFEIVEIKNILYKKEHTVEMDRNGTNAFDKKNMVNSQKHEADSGEKKNENAIGNKETCGVKEHELKKKHEANVDEKENDESLENIACNETSDEIEREHKLEETHEDDFDSKEIENNIAIEMYRKKEHENESMPSKEVLEIDNKMENHYVEKREILFDTQDSNGFDVQLKGNKEKIVVGEEGTARKETREIENETTCNKIEDTSLDKTIHYTSFVRNLVPQKSPVVSNLHVEITKEPRCDGDETHLHLKVHCEQDEKHISQSPVPGVLPHKYTGEGCLHHEITKEPTREEEEHLAEPSERDKNNTLKSPVQDLLLQKSTLEGNIHDEIAKEPTDDKDEKHARLPSKRDEKGASKSSVQDLLPQETTLEGNLHKEIMLEPTRDKDESHLTVTSGRDEKDISTDTFHDVLAQETTREINMHFGITKESKCEEDETYLLVSVPNEGNLHSKKETLKCSVQDLLSQETTLEVNVHDEITKKPTDDKNEKHLSVPSERDENYTSKSSIQYILTLDGNFYEAITKESTGDDEGKHRSIPSERDKMDTLKCFAQDPLPLETTLEANLHDEITEDPTYDEDEKRQSDEKMSDEIGQDEKVTLKSAIQYNLLQKSTLEGNLFKEITKDLTCDEEEKHQTVPNECEENDPLKSLVKDILPLETTQESNLLEELFKELKRIEDEKQITVLSESDEKDTQKSSVQDLLPQEATLKDHLYDDISKEKTGDEGEKDQRVPSECDEEDTLRSSVQHILSHKSIQEGNLHKGIINEPTRSENENNLSEQKEKVISKSAVLYNLLEETIPEGNLYDEITKESTGDGEEKHQRVPSELDEEDTIESSVEDILPQKSTRESNIHEEISKGTMLDEDDKHITIPSKCDEKDSLKTAVQDLLLQETALEGNLYDEITEEPTGNEKHIKIPSERDEKNVLKDTFQDTLPQEITREENVHFEINKEPRCEGDETYFRLRVASDQSVLSDKKTLKSTVRYLLPKDITLDGNLYDKITKEPTSDEEDKRQRVPSECDEKDFFGSSVQDLLPQETALQDSLHDEFTVDTTGDEDENLLNVHSEHDEKDTSKFSVKKLVYLTQLSIPSGHKFDSTRPKSSETIHSEPDNLEHQRNATASVTRSPSETYEVTKQNELFITDENQASYSAVGSSEDVAKVDELDTEVKPSFVSNILVAKWNLKSRFKELRSVVSRAKNEVIQIEPDNVQNKIEIFSTDKETRTNPCDATSHEALSHLPILSEPLDIPRVRTKSSSYRNRLYKPESKKIFKRPKKVQPKTPIHVTFDNVEELLHQNTFDSSKLLEIECSTIGKDIVAANGSKLNKDMRMKKFVSVSDFNQAAEELCRMFSVLSLKGEIELVAGQHHDQEDLTNNLNLRHFSNADARKGTSIDELAALMSTLNLGITNYLKNQTNNDDTSNVGRYFHDQAFACNLGLETNENDRNLFKTNVTASSRIEINLKEYLRYHFPENERFFDKPTSARRITWAPSEVTENVRNFDSAGATFEKMPQLSLFSDQLSNEEEREMPLFRTLGVHLVNNENTESETKDFGTPLTGTENNDILEPKQSLKSATLSLPSDKVTAINFKYISREPSYNQDESREKIQQECNLDATLLKEEELSSIDVHIFPPAAALLQSEQNGDVEFEENHSMASNDIVIGISKIEPLVQCSRVNRIQNRLIDGLQRLESYICSKSRISLKKKQSKELKMIECKAEYFFMEGSTRDEKFVGGEVDVGE